MALRDLSEFFDPHLRLPIRGKWYTVEAPDAETSLRIREFVTTDGVPPVEQIDQALRVLGAEPVIETIPADTEGEPDRHVPTGRWEGGAFSEMVADGVPWPMILHAGRTALLHFGFSPDMAEIHWQMAQLGRLVDLERLAELMAHPKQE